MGKKEWGFLREKRSDITELDPSTGRCRTALIDYLLEIFPNTTEESWIHDKIVDTIPKDERKKYRPDYRNENLKLIVEFDGLQHYSDIINIEKDEIKTEYYKKYGYKVVRIPYFIQLTNDAIFKLFGIHMEREMFPEGVASLYFTMENTPAFLPHQGIIRMAKDFLNFPEQYKTNIESMKNSPVDKQKYLEWELLSDEYEKILKKQ